MWHSTRVVPILAVPVVLGLVAQPVLGQLHIRYSEYEGGQQIWITADAFVARSTDGGSPNFILDLDANDPLSGSAYYFYLEGAVSDPNDQLNWWAEYQVPTSSVPAHFDLSGTWYFQARTQQPPEPEQEFWYADADYLFVNGHAGDLNTSNPTDDDWWAAVGARTNEDDRILNDLHLLDPKPYRPNWAWVAHNPSTSRPKTLAVIDGDVTFRIYEREASPDNARIDVMVFANSESYVPTDDDFLNAIPEPATLSLLALGGLGVMRRRWR